MKRSETPTQDGRIEASANPDSPAAEERPPRDTRRIDPACKWWARILRIVILMGTDIAVLLSVSVAVVAAWAVGVRGQPFGVYFEVFPFLAFFVLGFAQAGLYPGFGLGAVETLRRLWLWTSFLFLVLAATSFVFRAPHHYSRFVVAATWVGYLFLLPVARVVVLHFMQRSRWWAEPAVVVGLNPIARRTIQSLSRALSLGYRPRWTVSVSPGHSAPESFEGLPVLRSLEEAERLGHRGVRVALVTVSEGESWKWLVPRLQQSFRQVLLIRSSDETPVEGIEPRNLGGVLGLQFRNQLLQRRNRLIKRLADITMGSLAVLAAAPIIVVGGLLIKLLDPGPALFCQERIGRKRRLIRVCKLRTMYSDAEERLREHLASDPAARAEWERRFKLTNDPRILPGIGQLMRRFSIDELPQLWSVVKGDMSLVGPRPFPEYHLREFVPEFRSLREKVRPGLTGLWQVMVRSEGGLEEQELFDTYYIRNWSLWMDLYVIGKTVGAVLRGRGAY